MSKLYNITFFLGVDACAWSEFRNIDGDLYCFGRYACRYIKVMGYINGTVYAIGGNSIYFTDIFSRVETVCFKISKKN